MSSTKSAGIATRALSLIIYLLFPILAIGMLSYSTYTRGEQVVEPITQYYRYVNGLEKAAPAPIVESDPLSKKLIAYFQKMAELHKDKAMDEKEIAVKIEEAVEKRSRSKAMFVAVLALLPFFVLGWGLVTSPNVASGDMLRIAGQDWFMKYLLAFATAYGWVYVFSPMGQGASYVNDFIISLDVVSSSTLPSYLSSGETLSYPLVAFLGWYLNLIGYFFYRLYQGDISSTAVFGKMFQKLLFVYGITLVISSTLEDSSMQIVPFLIGFFPMSVFSILKEKGIQSAGSNASQEGALSALPSISRWQVMRLEEEGIPDLVSLSAADQKELVVALPFPPSLINGWIDAAQLAAIVKSQKYAELSSFCMTGSYFIKMAGDATFASTLSEKFGIDNPQEIAGMLAARGVTAAS